MKAGQFCTLATLSVLIFGAEVEFDKSSGWIFTASYISHAEELYLRGCEGSKGFRPHKSRMCRGLPSSSILGKSWCETGRCQKAVTLGWWKRRADKSGIQRRGRSFEEWLRTASPFCHRFICGQMFQMLEPPTPPRLPVATITDTFFNLSHSSYQGNIIWPLTFNFWVRHNFHPILYRLHGRPHDLPNLGTSHLVLLTLATRWGEEDESFRWMFWRWWKMVQVPVACKGTMWTPRLAAAANIAFQFPHNHHHPTTLGWIYGVYQILGGLKYVVISNGQHLTDPLSPPSSAFAPRPSCTNIFDKDFLTW